MTSITLFSTFISSCANWLPEAHRQDVLQGNEIKQEMLNKIHPGMNKSEITSIIGNPSLKDPFHANRWDYIYRFIPGRQEAEQSRLTLYFEGEKLIRIDDSEYKEPRSLDGSEDKEPKPLDAKEE
ncbi:MAG: outer membrane protein assembly factor BamE [Gammaproteobacteria bacterium]|nr:outer membrane protein assembly factor BamE [Gammaproteobacteria bacterium]